MPPWRVGAYFDVFETALMKLSTDNEPDINDVRNVLANLKRFQGKMLSLGGSMVMARHGTARRDYVGSTEAVALTLP